MKKNDILLLVVIAIVAGVMSLVIASFLFGGEKKYTLEAPEAQVISPTLSELDPEYFNPTALNPTKNITIGEDPNQEPFKGQ